MNGFQEICLLVILPYGMRTKSSRTETRYAIKLVKQHDMYSDYHVPRALWNLLCMQLKTKFPSLLERIE